MAGSTERLRPHVKTHKLGEVVDLQLQQGISRFKCATLSEVAMVAGAGGVDILLAYPLLGPGIKMWLDLLAGHIRESRWLHVEWDAAAVPQIELNTRPEATCAICRRQMADHVAA